MEFYRFSTQPGGFMAFETIWNFCTFFVYLFKITRLDSLSSVVKMSSVESNRTVAHDVICYSLRSVMEICRYNTNPKTNALIDCIYHSQAPPAALLSPAGCTPLPYIYDIFRHFMTHLDAFRQFWHILRYIYFEQDGTDSNICNGDDVKMVTSDLSARINDVLRYVGITRNMNAYIILSQAPTLIAEDEDRLRAVEKAVYTPIADKKMYEPKAVQSTIRQASKVAWDLCPDRAFRNWLAIL